MHDIHGDKVLILDFGSQYTQLIARRVREVGVYNEIYPFDLDEAAIRRFSPKAVILSGGPESVTGNNSWRAPDIVFQLGVPVLGICYGMQTMAQQLGGQVAASSPARVRLCEGQGAGPFAPVAGYPGRDQRGGATACWTCG